MNLFGWGSTEEKKEKELILPSNQEILCSDCNKVMTSGRITISDIEGNHISTEFICSKCNVKDINKITELAETVFMALHKKMEILENKHTKEINELKLRISELESKQNGRKRKKIKQKNREE